MYSFLIGLKKKKKKLNSYTISYIHTSCMVIHYVNLHMHSTHVTVYTLHTCDCTPQMCDCAPLHTCDCTLQICDCAHTTHIWLHTTNGWLCTHYTHVTAHYTSVTMLTLNICDCTHMTAYDTYVTALYTYVTVHTLYTCDCTLHSIDCAHTTHLWLYTLQTCTTNDIQRVCLYLKFVAVAISDEKCWKSFNQIQYVRHLKTSDQSLPSDNSHIHYILIYLHTLRQQLLKVSCDVTETFWCIDTK